MNRRVRLVIGKQSLRHIAKITNVSVESVRRYFNGGTPSSDFLGRLSNKLGLNAEWLLTGDGPMMLEGLAADALQHATVEQIVGEIARKFDGLSDRVTRLEVAVFAASRAMGAPSREPTDK